MKKYILQNDKKEIIQSMIAVVCASVIFLCMILMGPTQDTGDDAFLAWQLSRENGSLASFISPYLSIVLSCLYAHIPLAWWSLFLVCGGYVLLIVVYNYILKNCRGLLRISNMLLWAIFIWIAVIEKINFTRTATAYALAGILLLLQIVLASNENKRCLIKGSVGVFFLLIGAMCRFQAALLVLPFFFIIIVYKYFWISERKLRSFFQVLRKKIVLIFLPLIFLSVLAIFNKLYWDLNPDWKEYNYYNQVRSEIADYIEYYPTWEEAENEYKKLGLKEKNDLDLLFTWVFVGDTDVFSLETLEGIRELRRDVTINERFQGMVNRVQEMLATGKVLPYIIIYMCIYIIVVGKKTVFPIFVNMSCAFSILVFFSFLGRMMLRVWEPTLLCSAAVTLVIFNNNDNVEKGYLIGIEKNNCVIKKICLKTRWLVLGISMALFLCCISKFNNSFQIPSYNQDRDNITRARAEYMNEKRESIFLLAQPIIHHPANPSVFGIWEPIKTDFCTNYYALSNWEARTPYNIERLKKIGIKNPVKALYERIDTYSIFDAQLFEFLKCHYDEDMTCSIVDTFEDTGMIVQYSKPFTKFDNILKESYVYELEETNIYETPAVILQGKIRKKIDITALFINIEYNEKTYSYRLNYSSNGCFYSTLYDMNLETFDKADNIFLVAKNSKGDNIKICKEQ